MARIRQPDEMVHIVDAPVDLNAGAGGDGLGEGPGHGVEPNGRRRLVGKLNENVETLRAGEEDGNVALAFGIAPVDLLNEPADIGQGGADVRPVNVQHDEPRPARASVPGHAVPARPVVVAHLRSENEVTQVGFAVVVHRAICVGLQQVLVSHQSTRRGRRAENVRADRECVTGHFAPLRFAGQAAGTGRPASRQSGFGRSSLHRFAQPRRRPAAARPRGDRSIPGRPAGTG